MHTIRMEMEILFRQIIIYLKPGQTFLDCMSPNGCAGGGKVHYFTDLSQPFDMPQAGPQRKSKWMRRLKNT